MTGKKTGRTNKPGAGRPPAPKGPGKRYNVYLNNDVHDYLNRSGNVSAEIDRLAREEMQEEKGGKDD